MRKIAVPGLNLPSLEEQHCCTRGSECFHVSSDMVHREYGTAANDICLLSDPHCSMTLWHRKEPLNLFDPQATLPTLPLHMGHVPLLSGNGVLKGADSVRGGQQVFPFVIIHHHRGA